MKRFCLLGYPLALAILCLSCSADEVTIAPADTTPQYRSLAKRDNLLFNLELAYNSRNINKFSELLDDNFIFYFGAMDIREGNVDQPQWDRDSENEATRNLFLGPTPLAVDDGSIVGAASFTEESTWGRLKALYQSPVNVPPADRIAIDIRYPNGEDVWQEITPADPEKYPGETWYEKTVDYNLTVVIGAIDLTLTNSNPRQTSFVVRWDEEKKAYQIVLWRDDIGNN